MTTEIVQLSKADLQELLADVVTKSQSRWLTIEGASAYTNLSADSIRRMLAAGALTKYMPRKGRILIDRRELDSAILGAKAR